MTVKILTPTGLKFAVILICLVTLLQMFGNISLVLISMMPVKLFMSVVFLILFPLLRIYVAYKLYRGETWAWYVILILVGLKILPLSWMTFFWVGIFLYLLLNESVRNHVGYYRR
jgi:hypothetical protein